MTDILNAIIHHLQQTLPSTIPIHQKTIPSIWLEQNDNTITAYTQKQTHAQPFHTIDLNDPNSIPQLEQAILQQCDIKITHRNSHVASIPYDELNFLPDCYHTSLQITLRP